VIYNWVDPRRFAPRRALPARPRRALVFSNYAGRDALAVLRHPCAAREIALDVVGSSTGNATGEPERVLPETDAVFAQARSALEAMAAGAAVVLFGPSGLGPLVTAREIRRLRPLNFGMRVIATPVTIENVYAELARYDAADAARVTAWIREHAGPRPAIDAWRALYREVARRPRRRHRPPGRDRLAIARFLEGLGAYTWSLVETSARLQYEVERNSRTDPPASPSDAPPPSDPPPPSEPAPGRTLRDDPACPGDEDFLRRLYASSRLEELAVAAGSAAQAEALVRMQFAAQQREYREAFPHAVDRIVLAGGEPVGRFYVNRAPEE